MDQNIVKHSSVRVTLRISEQGNAILDELVSMYQVSQKELFYRLAEVFETMSMEDFECFKDESQKNPKTMVLPKLALDALTSSSERLLTHRDEILGVALNYLNLSNQNEKKMVTDMKEHIADLSNTVAKIDKLMIENLGKNHPITERLGIISLITDNLLSSIQSHLEYGSQISPDDFTDVGNDVNIMGKTSQGGEISNHKRVFIKRYKSKVPNVTKSLTKTLSTAKIRSEILNPFMMNKVKNYERLAFWDFGVRATKHLKKGDVVWIVTGDSYYKAEIVEFFDDPDGQICDAIGWARQFKQPWKTPVALTNVEEVKKIPEQIIQAMYMPHIQGVPGLFAL